MTFRTLLAVAVIAVMTACLGGCGSSGDKGDGGNPPGDGPASEGGVVTDACTAIAGKSFMSKIALECGLGAPDGGLILCHWHITFTKDGATSGSYSWQHSDTIQSGTYSCHANSVTGLTGGGATIAGTWNGTTGVLTWAGDHYQGS